MRGERRRIIVRKCGRQNANHWVTLAVERNLLSDQIGISAIALLPETVAQDDGSFVLRILLGKKETTTNWLNAQDRKQIRADTLAGDLLRLVIPGNVEEVRFKRRHAVENLVLFSPVEEIFARNNIFRPATMRLLFPNHHKLVCFRIWQRPEKDGVDYAEDGGIRSDAQRQRDHRDGGESGAFAQLPHRIAQIFADIHLDFRKLLPARVSSPNIALVMPTSNCKEILYFPSPLRVNLRDLVQIRSAVFGIGRLRGSWLRRLFPLDRCPENPLLTCLLPNQRTSVV